MPGARGARHNIATVVGSENNNRVDTPTEPVSMSITLNNSDFQCLQDQLLDLKNKNYELAEKNRRGQADFEAAKAKICNLQLKLEEQERDFQVTSTTLRREIEAAALSNTCDQDVEDSIDYKAENKKLSLRIEELEQHQAGSLEIMQQMDAQNRILEEKTRELDASTSALRAQLETSESKTDLLRKECEEKLLHCVSEYKSLITELRKKHTAKLEVITNERDSLKSELEKAAGEVKELKNKLESQSEEQKLQDRQGSKIVRELKRQLAGEKANSTRLQIRLEQLLSEPSEPPEAETPPASDCPNISTASDSQSSNQDDIPSEAVNTSISLNDSDFQCLQDQLLDLKSVNYELTEKNRRSQADFEAAKAKIYDLQLKLEEQERDFQMTFTTLRREIEASKLKQQYRPSFR